MQIGELARAAGVSTSRIRFYEARGLLPSAARRENGYRSYEPRVLKFLALIERAQRLGFSLKEIKAFLAPPSGRPSPESLLPHLETKLRELDRHLAEVRRRRREIATLREELRAQVQEAAE